MQTGGTKHSLLLVDGDPNSLRVLDVSLKKAGFQVTATTSAAEALAALEIAVPDLIISDTHMTEMDGFELCRRIKERPEWSKISFIFLSGHKSIEAKVRGLELGVEDYLTKPIYIKEITTRVRMLLQRQQRERLESSREGRTKFSGQLTDIGVIDLVQTIEVNRKSGIIHIQSRENRKGAIYFRDGKVIDAEVGRLSGPDALYRLFSWSEGLFEVEFKSIRRKDIIELSQQALLMEGMRRLDEWTHLLDTLPPLETVFEVDYQLLAKRLAEIPDEVNRILRLFDGRRSLAQVIDDCDFPDLEALSIIGRLHGVSVIYESHAAHAQDAPTVVKGPDPGAERLDRWLARGDSTQVGPTDGGHAEVPEAVDDISADEPGRAEEDFGEVRTAAGAVDPRLSEPEGLPEPDPQEASGWPADFLSGPEADDAGALPVAASASPGVDGLELEDGPAAEAPADVVSDGSDLSEPVQGAPTPRAATLHGHPQLAATFGEDLFADEGVSEEALFSDPPPTTGGNQPLTGIGAVASNRPVVAQTEGAAGAASEMGAAGPDVAGSQAALAAMVGRPNDVDTLTSTEMAAELGLPSNRRPLLIAVGVVGVAGVLFALSKAQIGPFGVAHKPVVTAAAPGPKKVVVPVEPDAAPITAPSPAPSPPVVAKTPSAAVAQVPPSPPVSAPSPAKPPALPVRPSVASVPSVPVAAKVVPEAPPASDFPAAKATCRKAYESRKYKDIVLACKRALEIKADAADVMVMLAHAELDRGRAGQALAWATKAAAADPNLAEAYVFIGGAEQEAGRRREAKDAYKKYLELAPKGQYANDVRAIIGGL